MGRPAIVYCRRCGRHVDECGPLSLTRKCSDCGHEVLDENLDQLHYHSGPRFEHWRRRTLAAFGIFLPSSEVSDEEL